MQIIDSKQPSKIITRAEDITPAWLASVLNVDVSNVRVILSKELHVSTVYRLAIDGSDEAPRTLFLKLSKPLLDGFEPGDLYRPEVEFYRNIAPAIGVPPLIKCYDAVFDGASGRSHLLMEDLSDTHAQPEQKTTPSDNLSLRAVETLARVHRSFWSSAELGKSVGKLFTEECLSSFVENLARNVAEFTEFAELSKSQRDIYRMMLEAAPKIWGRLLNTSSLTVTHGDMHWWNFLYPTADDFVRIFDWQLWHIDLGARDLAFLLALGGFAEPRPSIENGLLHAYHDELNVDRYTFEMLMLDYRASAIRNLNIPIIFWKQGKHYSTWQDALRRALDGFERLGCGELC